ncbi:uncharacterized protein NFIA_098980 [Aspergillus fischeri NRRL 181]|uniref:Paraoxonase n=1 Tax=Neosartorya fischeri (strain ATCC 1020 / DSM 3700 / CBS 544.65 / FGSC A1164 / JCM 1740 / NRRL 181 / WB 181) TaxID=331117 RepID=A1DBM4_NEOFI|nr:conserved hypothetical protein [Aspergillus fischeri NRRL 181]EAW20264.1 conserved hypothetical protein [Aspergillus fischeri NRRL 181]KAG2001754.1 hypothetical protein GB937_009910 [Aspergillus fischeri]
MAPLKTIFIALLAIAIGLYKVHIHLDAANLFPKVGRAIQRLDDFPDYQCRRMRHPLLESCEDVWLDSGRRRVYAACANPMVRVAWSPGGNSYDLAGRAAGGGGIDHITVLDIDQPGADGLHGVRELKFRDSQGNIQTLDLHGFDARVIDKGRRVRFWLINHRPPLDPFTGAPLLDATQVGANSTIDVYDLDLHHGDKLEHVKTIVSETIISPNNLVVIDDDEDKGGFLFTNDHNTKVSPSRDKEIGGSISYCRTDTGECHFAATENFSFPNGITRDPFSGLIYIAHSARGTVTVHRVVHDQQLVQIDEISLSMGVDNLSIDTDGNIFAATIPDHDQFIRAFHDPYGTDAPSTVVTIKKKRRDAEVSSVKEEYEVIKVVEDGEARILPTTTCAVHDPISSRLFLGALSSPFMVVCEKQE